MGGRRAASSPDKHGLHGPVGRHKKYVFRFTKIMSACARLILPAVRTIYRHPYRGRRYFHPSRSITAAKTLYSRRRLQFSYRMTSGISRASVTPAQTLTLSNGDCFEVVAASGLSETGLRNAIDSTLFKQWLTKMQSERGLLAGGQMHLRRVEVQGVDMFGNSVGFLKFRAEVFDKQTGMKVPGIVFARGPSVAVLILLKSGGESYVVLTEQVRVPVGKLILEIPAGMVDDGGDVIGTAVREVEEETGINLKVQDMVNLTAFLDPGTDCRVFPSPGGCDEELSIFLYEGIVAEEVIKALQGKEMGLREHGELIKVHVIPYNKLWRITADAKALTAIALYEMARRDGLLLRGNA